MIKIMMTIKKKLCIIENGNQSRLFSLIPKKSRYPFSISIRCKFIA